MADNQNQSDRDKQPPGTPRHPPATVTIAQAIINMAQTDEDFEKDTQNKFAFVVSDDGVEELAWRPKGDLAQFKDATKTKLSYTASNVTNTKKRKSDGKTYFKMNDGFTVEA